MEPITPGRFLSRNNFDYFDWSNASVRHLKMKECDCEIPSAKLDLCEDNITTIDFIGLTSYTNIKILLHRCTNLKRLFLTNILLNHYDTDFKRFFLIEVPELTHLKFTSHGKLSKSEMHLIDFLFRRVRFGALQSICFESCPGHGKKGNIKNNINGKSPQKSKVTLRNKFTKVSVNASSLVNLLIQNRFTLKTLEVRRAGIALSNEKLDNANLNEPEPEHLKLQLEKFDCDMGNVGFDRILNQQNHLQVLHCCNKKSFSPSSLEAAMNAVRRCSGTLKEIRFIHHIHGGGDNNNSEKGQQLHHPDLLHHDCSIYKYCSNLKRLHVTVSALTFSSITTIITTDQDQQQQRLNDGALLNVRLLPLTISHLVLRFEAISQHGLDLFINSKLVKMSQLKFFVCQGSTKCPFKVKLPFIQALAELTIDGRGALDIFELSHCLVEDLRAIEDFKKSRHDLHNYLEVTENKCLYWGECKKTETRKV